MTVRDDKSLDERNRMWNLSTECLSGPRTSSKFHRDAITRCMLYPKMLRVCVVFVSIRLGVDLPYGLIRMTSYINIYLNYI